MIRQSRRNFVKAALAGAASVALPVSVRAQAYPSRPIRLICPFTAGGSTDAVMRAVADSAGKTLGGSIIVENKTGAGGTLGVIELANAKPDGYTLSQTPISIFRIPHMQKTQFDPIKDVTYICCLTGYIFGLVVRGDSPIRSIRDVIEFARANPGTFTYGSSGVGTSPHLAIEEFAQRAGIQLVHVPYKGVADGIQAVLGGHVMAHSDSTGWASHVDAGTLRLLAVYGSKRTKRWPNIPTLQELGYDTVADSPWGFGGPKGMDPAIVSRLHDAFKNTLDDPVVLGSLEKYDQPVIYMGSLAYTKYARDALDRKRQRSSASG